MTVSAEVLDCLRGRAAEGVPVTLHQEIGACWEQRASALTDESGRVPTLADAPARGRYRIALDIDKYFPTLGIEPLQSRVEVTFRVFEAGEHVHFLVSITPSSVIACQTIDYRNASGR